MAMTTGKKLRLIATDKAGGRMSNGSAVERGGLGDAAGGGRYRPLIRPD
jgi:hypothetical protein